MNDGQQSRKKGGAFMLWGGVVLAFVILIFAWTTLIKIAVKNKPEVIDLKTEQTTQLNEEVEP